MSDSNSNAEEHESALHQVVALLALHRILTTAQLQTMLQLSRRRVSQCLVQLHREKLANYGVLDKHNSKAWFLTLGGAKIVNGWPELRDRPVRPLHSVTDAALRNAHTNAVTRTHLAFLHDARNRGHDHRPLDWLPEMSHRLPDTGSDDRLVADALAFYSVPPSEDRPRLNYRAFIEVDRATMSSQRLARKLIAYARFHSYRPLPPGRRGSIADQGASLAWQRYYTRFPRILFVLTNGSADKLAQRITDLRAMASGHPLVATMANAPEISLGAAVLEELEEAGPCAEVWTPLVGSRARKSWLDL